MNDSKIITCVSVSDIENIDEADHLGCLKKKVLAYMASIGAPIDMLFYGALENTNDIYKATYTDKKYRWEYDVSYLNEADWHLLGFFAGRPDDEFDFDSFVAMTREEIINNRPVFFYAPGGDIPFYYDLKCRGFTGGDDPLTLHSFMVVGLNESSSKMSFYEIFNGNGVYDSAVDEIGKRYNEHPELWFADSFSLYRTEGVCKKDEIYNLHRKFVDEYSDDLGLYEFMLGMFEFELTQNCLPHELPSVNACALLCGSRMFYTRYLRSAGYGVEVIDVYDRLLCKLRRLQVDLFQMFALKDISRMSKIGVELKAIKCLELQGMERVREVLSVSGGAILAGV